MKTGKQLTEAMLLNGRANSRDAAREFSRVMHLLSANMAEALRLKGVGDASARVSREMGIIKKFTEKSNNLEKEYNAAREWVETGLSDIDGFLVDIINGTPKTVAKSIREVLVKNTHRTYHEYLVKRDGPLQSRIDALAAALDKYVDEGNKETLREALTAVREIYARAEAEPKPDFFAMGYYLLYSGKPLESGNIQLLNDTVRNYMNTSFMDAFLEDAAAAIKLSHERAMGKKQGVIDLIDKYLPYFKDDSTTPAQCHHIAHELTAAVENSLDKLAIVKDSFAYTFHSSIDAAIASYLRMRHIAGKKRLKRKDRELIGSGDLDMYRANVSTDTHPHTRFLFGAAQERRRDRLSRSGL